jgi:hypothetical protein
MLTKPNVLNPKKVSNHKSATAFPDTLLLRIFSYLDVKQNVRLANACLRFRLLIGREEAFWQQQYATQFKVYNSRERSLEEYFEKKLDYLYSNNDDTSKVRHKSRLPLDSMRRFCVKMQWLNNWKHGHYTTHKLSALHKSQTQPIHPIQQIVTCKNHGIVVIDAKNNIYFISYYTDSLIFQQVKKPCELELTDVNNVEERSLFTDLKSSQYIVCPGLKSSIAANTDYLITLASNPSGDAFVVFWKLDKGILKQARWFKLQGNKQIKLLHKNWLILGSENFYDSPSETYIYNLEDTWFFSINVSTTGNSYSVIESSLNHIELWTIDGSYQLSLDKKVINDITLHSSHVKTWCPRQSRSPGMAPSKFEPYDDGKYVLCEDSRGTITILSHSERCNALNYTGYVRYVSSKNARAYIERDGYWTLIDLDNETRTSLGSISKQLSYVGIAAGEYLVLARQHLGFIIMSESAGQLTQCYRIPATNIAGDVDDVSIVYRSSDSIELLDFSGLIQS